MGLFPQFMRAIIVILVSDSPVRGAQVVSLQRRAAGSSHSEIPEAARRSNNSSRQADEHSRITARAPQSFPFWTWFIDNPRPFIAASQLQ